MKKLVFKTIVSQKRFNQSPELVQYFLQNYVLLHQNTTTIADDTNV